MKHHVLLLATLLLLANLCLAPAAQAQFSWRWFGPKADKNAPAKTDPRRAVEVNVEVAWLADAVTFPYYLEAHADNNQLEVRGYVPNKAVRDHAVRIAQVYSSLPVADAMKEHPSLLIRPTPIAPQQLQASVQASLRTALPKQYQQLKVECGADGKVFVLGPVTTLEEKIAVSHSLRRLHGCTSVQNLTTLPADLAAVPKEKLPIVKVSAETSDKTTADAKSKSWFSWPFGRLATTTTEEPPLLDRKPSSNDGKGPVLVDAKNQKIAPPILIPNNVAEPKKDPEVKEPPVVVAAEVPSVPAKRLTSTELQKSIQTACPKVVSVEVELTSAKELRVTLEIRTDAELSPTAEKVFALPELQEYRLDLQFKISAP